MNTLDQMKEYLQQNGWYQGGYYQRDLEGKAAVCLLGAYHCVTETDTSSFRAQETEVIAEVIAEQFPERILTKDLFDVITTFNDSWETTFEDVEVVLDKAAVRLDDAV